MRYFIYIHTCPNGKKYIGQTTFDNPNKRWKLGEGYKSNKHFYNAIQKYGWDNIDHKYFEVETKELMNFWEASLIHHYKTTDRQYGYNKLEGGEKWHKKFNHSEEFKKNLSESRKGENGPFYGKKHSLTTIKKMKDNHRGGVKLHSDEAKKAISVAARLRWADPEYKSRVLESRKRTIEMRKNKPNNIND